MADERSVVPYEDMTEEEKVMDLVEQKMAQGTTSIQLCFEVVRLIGDLTKDIPTEPHQMLAGYYLIEAALKVLRKHRQHTDPQRHEEYLLEMYLPKYSR